MSLTEESIENLAAALCRLSQPEHKHIYIEALQSVARTAQAELIFQMQLGFDNATTGQKTTH
ncbi:MAG: hypothetical protein A3I66_01355 [Burkholderiales bacterium RIFCSPLOWO2_02_FULL_57_36]|nr:MAG: hypothetical protein A3I66_01355 [Burkholderiales bacterium RIFCSPLOWO2_02_FULL_57_36]